MVWFDVQLKQTREESKKIEPSSLLIQVNSLIMFSLKYTPVTWNRLLPLTFSKVNCSKNASFLMADLEIRKTFSRMSLTWGDFGWNGGSCKDTDFQLMPINTNTASTFSSMLLWNVAVLGKVWGLVFLRWTLMCYMPVFVWSGFIYAKEL